MNMNYTNTLPLAEYPMYHFARAEVIPGISDKYLSILSPFAAYWILSLFFTVIDNLNWDMFERYRIHEPEELKKKNRVTARQVVLAVLLQQAIQTAMGLVWLEDDSAEIGPMRDHYGDLRGYERIVSKVVVTLLGKNLGGTVLSQAGGGLTSWVYWWGVPIVQYFFAA